MKIMNTFTSGPKICIFVKTGRTYFLCLIHRLQFQYSTYIAYENTKQRIALLSISEQHRGMLRLTGHITHRTVERIKMKHVLRDPLYKTKFLFSVRLVPRPCNRGQFARSIPSLPHTLIYLGPRRDKNAFP
jgi:hypothetical protein